MILPAPCGVIAPLPVTRSDSVRFICKVLQGDDMAQWEVKCVCGCNEFTNEKNVYVVTGDLDDQRGELITVGDCIECGKNQSVV